MDQKKVVLILSGCGVNDGSEIHEATLCLLALDRAGAKVTIAAPDIPQARVFDHAKGAEVPGESRNVLAESARIARGSISLLSQLDPNSFDAVLLPGGYGAALNLCNLANKGSQMTVEPTVASFLTRARIAGKAIGALCIAPPLVAKVLGDAGTTGVKMTIGNDPGTAEVIQSFGQVHVNCPATECVVDTRYKVVTGPAYMLAGGLAELWIGIDSAVRALIEVA